MKKLYALTVCVLFCLASSAQPSYYQPWDSATATGPLNFMTLDVQNHPYIWLSYNELYNVDNFTNSTAPGPNAHHQLRTTDGPDPCRCYSIIGNTYVHENYLPTPYLITKPDGSPVDTVIQLGSTSLNNNTQIEYWFYPTVNESVLLVCPSFSAENITSHDELENPRFYIEVLDGQTGTLINPTSCYPTEATINNPNPTPNLNWPYSRFLAVPSGEHSSQDHYVWSDGLQNYVYYWAYPQATPTTWPYRICPDAQNGSSTSWDVIWLEYKPIAFDLSSYAAQHKSVKLRIRSRSCQYFAHWSYALFYAKMVSGGGIVTSTDEQPLFHISAPQGFMEPTYEWHYGYDYTDAVNRPEFEIYNTPGVTASGPYDIFIDPAATAPNFHIWPYFCCKVRSYTGVPFVFEYHLRKYHIDADFSYQPDSGDVVHFQDFSSVCYTVPGVGFDTVYEDIHQFRWYVKQNGEFTLFAENESNPSYTFTPATVSDGEATVMLVVSDNRNLVNDTVVKSFPISLTGVPTHERNSVTVTPNPTHGTVRVSADRDIQNIRILNADGKLLNSITVQDKTSTLDLSHYEGYLFLLDIRFKDSGNVVKKVVKR